MSEEIKNSIKILNLENALKYYIYTKIAQKKYRATENGKQKTRESNQRYYEKKKQNPEFMENQRIKAREKYQKKKNMLNNLEFQILI